MPVTPRVIAFTAAVEAQRSVLDASRVLSGTPECTVWNHYADPSEQFFAGIWSATRGRWTVRYTEHEFCHLLAGRVVLTSESGERLEFSRGDSFV
ncbi:MAG TPA: cupin domain-containing protein, partial [Steroidobacteraceae bacterium]